MIFFILVVFLLNVIFIRVSNVIVLIDLIVLIMRDYQVIVIVIIIIIISMKIFSGTKIIFIIRPRWGPSLWPFPLQKEENQKTLC